MVKRLSEAGLIEHVPYRGVQLTSQGRRAALRMIRRHRLLEVYLTERLGYDWDGVHDEADRLEHAVSDELIERMAAALGQPRYDPHGEPIPTAAGDIEEPELMPPRGRRPRHAAGAAARGYAGRGAAALVRRAGAGAGRAHRGDRTPAVQRAHDRADGGRQRKSWGANLAQLLWCAPADAGEE